MRNWLERYFAFSRKEINGICVLVVLLSLLWIGALLIPLWSNRQPSEDRLAGRVAQIERFLASVEGPHQQDEGSRSAVAYFAFDPNELPASGWRRLGLSDRQVRMIENYRDRGGRFWKKTDLAKIYAISDADYARLEPYIRLPVSERIRDDEQSEEQPYFPIRKPPVFPVASFPAIELNEVDSIELQRLPGIGPVFASRVVRFRDLLGGFHHVSQLLDVYGMDSVRFKGFKEYVHVDSSRINKIDVNRADYERLKRHPLISPKLANAVVQYRKQHGPYRSLTDLSNIAIMDEDIFRKIVPYLTLSDD